MDAALPDAVALLGYVRDAAGNLAVGAGDVGGQLQLNPDLVSIASRCAPRPCCATVDAA
jgi:hypothetical protein